MITLENISVKYGDNVIYENFTYTFPAGVNVIVGKSGCGKTTLVNVVANLVDYTGKCQARGEIAIVFQQPCLAPVSVRRNIDLVLPKKNNDEQVKKILDLAQIAHKQDVNVQKLSGGEQQRVALARAFVAKRTILLLDEPFEGLDYGTKKQLQDVLCEMLQQGVQSDDNKCVLLVTHDIDEALALGDRIYLLHEKPCQLELIEDIDVPRNARDQFAEETLRLKAKLQQLLQ